MAKKTKVESKTGEALVWTRIGELEVRTMSALFPKKAKRG